MTRLDGARFGWYLCAFDRETERLVRQARLMHFGLPTMRRLWPGTADDDLCAGERDVDARLAKVLAKFTKRPIQLDRYDYQFGAVDESTPSPRKGRRPR